MTVFGEVSTKTDEQIKQLYRDNGFKIGSIVEVEIIHTPSQKSVYKGKVTVE